VGLRNRGLQAVIGACLAVSATAALIEPIDVRASSPVRASGQSHEPAPFHPKDSIAYAAEKQSPTAGQSGRREGVVAIPSAGQQQTPRALAPQTAQKVAGFPLMDLQRQVSLYPGQTVDPPDTQLAVGPVYLAEAVNSTLSIWTRSGASVAVYDLNAFFAVPAGYFLSDPRIIYDAESARWFLSGVAFNPGFDSQVLVATSSSSDPTGGWNKVLVTNATAVLQDQPFIGVSSDKVVISWNDYTGTSTYTGQETWVYEKADLLAGVPAPRHFAFPADTKRFRIVPAQSLTPTTTAWLVYNNADCFELTCTIATPSIGVVAITGTPAGNNVAWNESDLPIQATHLPPSPRQPSAIPVTKDIDDRFLSAVWQNGTLWTAGNDSCIPAGDSILRSCLRLVKVSTSGSTPTVQQDFDGGTSGLDYYYPAVTLDGSGNIFIAFSVSSPTLNPSAGAVDIRASSPSRFENVISLASGLGPHLDANTAKNRWGDYSGAAPDPINPAMVWVAAEYQTGNGGPYWGTAAARMTIQNSALTTITPQRLLDTRTTGGRLGPGASLSLTVAGPSTGAPADASAVVINVTVTNTNAASFLTAYPAGTPRPLASNLNWVAGQTVPNLVEVPIGSGNQVTFYNSAGATDLVVDLEGYYAAANSSAGQLQPLAPARILDTRTGNGAPAAKLGPTQTLNLQVTGRGGMPAAGVSAVVLNVTVTDPSAAGFLTVFPTGAGTPLASNLNFSAGQTVPNRVIVGVGTSGQVSIFNALDSADVIADVGGYFTDSSASGQLFIPLAPLRLLDTRSPVQTLGPGGTVNVSMVGARVPATATAVVLNVTATNTTAASFFTAFPAGAAQPLASDLNWVAGKTVPNLVVVKLGAGGVTLFNQFGFADAIADIFGYFNAPPVSVSANPSSIPADGSKTSTVTATVMSNGTPAANTSVTFTTGGGAACGIIGSPATTDAAGTATVTYTASTTVGSCGITATEAVDNLSGWITITQTAIANTITVTAAPTSIKAGGTTTSSITSTVTNGVTGPVAGDVVTYVLSPNPAGSCGTLSAGSATTGAGGTTPAVTYTASITAGTCTITATEAGSNRSGTAAITQT
jgi:hypothetical protein